MCLLLSLWQEYCDWLVWEPEIEEEVQQTPPNSQTSREMVGGGIEGLPLKGKEHHLTSSCWRGAGMLELLGQRVLGQGEKQLSTNPQSLQLGFFYFFVLPL